MGDERPHPHGPVPPILSLAESSPKTSVVTPVLGLNFFRGLFQAPSAAGSKFPSHSPQRHFASLVNSPNGESSPKTNNLLSDHACFGSSSPAQTQSARHRVDPARRSPGSAQGSCSPIF